MKAEPQQWRASVLVLSFVLSFGLSLGIVAMLAARLAQSSGAAAARGPRQHGAAAAGAGRRTPIQARVMPRLPVEEEGLSTIAKAARRHAGLYKDKQAHPALSRVVLVVACNYPLIGMLRDWECAAKRMGLDWLVVALDKQTFNHHGPERAVLFDG